MPDPRAPAPPPGPVGPPITEEELEALGLGRERALRVRRFLSRLRGLIRVNGGIAVRPHVQAFANACNDATGASSFGTYNGHQPAPDRALDIFHRISDRALSDAICAFYIANHPRFGGDYIISRRYIWNHKIGRYWRLMPDRGSPTQNHDDHAHVGFLPTGNATPAPGGPGQAPGRRTLSRGDSGADVAEAQTKLNAFGYGLVVDGDFGEATGAAVLNLQHHCGLTVDGEVGPQTWAVLDAGPPRPPAPPADPLQIGDRTMLLLANDLPRRALTAFSGKVADVGGADVRDGARVILWDDNGGKHQRIVVHPAGTREAPDMVRLVCAHSGRTLNVPGIGDDVEDGYEKAVGRHVVQWPDDGGRNGLWRIVPRDGNPSKVAIYSMIPPQGEAKPRLVLGTEDGSGDRGKALLVWPDENHDNHSWTLV